jgi:hypothetical protein
MYILALAIVVAALILRRSSPVKRGGHQPMPGGKLGNPPRSISVVYRPTGRPLPRTPPPSGND